MVTQYDIELFLEIEKGLEKQIPELSIEESAVVSKLSETTQAKRTAKMVPSSILLPPSSFLLDVYFLKQTINGLDSRESKHKPTNDHIPVSSFFFFRLFTDFDTNSFPSHFCY